MIILKELQIYSEEDLGIKLKVNNTILNEIIQEFQKKKIIKYNSKNQIQFVYIGIIIIREEIIFVLPKYTECMNEDEKKIVLKNIIRLLNDFSERENLNNSDIEHIDFEKESLENNLISIISFLIDDYIEYGIYKNEIDYIELNGNGDINWDITIDQIDPIVIDSQWIYTDLFTNMSKVDNNKFITLLHGKIINDCIDS
ncbi:MAG: LlaJI family restriction endonuclease [Romboutsia timonensis]